MQEIGSISKKESSSEPVKNELRDLAYDPLTCTLHVLSHAADKAKDLWMSRVPSPLLNQDQSKQNVQLSSMENPRELMASKFRNKLAQSGMSLEIQNQANSRENPRYLFPEATLETSEGKQIYSTDTYCQPMSLRFSPANSTNQVEISLSGKSVPTLTCGLGLTVKAKTANQVAQTKQGFSEGVHYWEIICPISCSSLHIGISNISQTSEVAQQFRTSTPRVIGVELNLDKMTLQFWLNGRFLKERTKKITEHHTWYPTIRFKEADLLVVLNPYAQGRGQGQEDPNNNYLPKQEEKFLDSIKEQLKLHGETKFKYQDVYLPPHDTLKSDSLICALIKFPNEQEAIKYYINNNAGLKLLKPTQIAKLIFNVQEEKELQKLGLPSTLDKPQEVAKFFQDILTSKLIEEKDHETFKIYSGQNVDHTFSQTLNLLHDSLVKGTLSLSLSKPHRVNQNQDQDSSVHYIGSSDKLLLTNNCGLKLITRSNGELDIFSNLDFDHYPQRCTDLVKLKVSRSEFQFILEHINWNSIQENHFPIIDTFLKAYQESSCPSTMIVPYIVAVQVVKLLTNVAIQQYEYLEQSFEELKEQEILHSMSKKQFKPQPDIFSNKISLDFEFGHISVLDIHQLLSILLTLEDQLWAKVQDDNTCSQAKDLWPPTCSRLHTAYGRLSSLITFPSSQNSVLDCSNIADMGLVNTNDKYGRVSFYQEFKVEVENLFQSQNQHSNDLLGALQKQFPFNLMLQGYPSFNVALDNTLNSFPPSIHDNNLKSKRLLKPESITKVKVLDNSDFVLTGGSDGSINIWSTKTRLHKVGGHNFKSKLHSTDEFDKLKPTLITKQLMLKEEEKKQDGEVKVILKKNIIHKPKQPDDKVEDLLFTMFDEQQDADETDQEDVQSDEALFDQELESLLDYQDQPQLAKLESPSQEKKEQKEEVKKSPEKTDKKEETKKEAEVVPKEDFLSQMIMMGFGIELSKKALIKVKNESVSAAIDVIEEIQNQQKVQEPPKEQVKKYKYLPFNCIACTFYNSQGGEHCEICGGLAPEASKIEEKSEDEIRKEQEALEKQKQLEEEQRKKEEEEKILKELEEQRKLEEEEMAKKKLAEFKEETIRYLKNTVVVDYIFGQYNNGKDKRPLLAGIVLQNHEIQRCDLHFIRFAYHQKYLKQFITITNNKTFDCRVCEVPFTSYSECSNHLFKFHQSLVESDYPVFIGDQIVNPKGNNKNSRHDFQTMSSEDCGTLVWPFKEIRSVCQIGQSMTANQPLLIFGVGQKANSDKQSIVLVKIDYSGKEDHQDFKIETIDEDSQIFVQAGMNEPIKQLQYCNKSDKLVVLTESGKLFLFKLRMEENKLVSLEKVGEIDGVPNSSILKIDYGIVYVETQNDVKRFIIDEKLLQQREQHSFTQEKMVIGGQIIEEEEVLKLRIDKKKVTMKDISRYEELMNGKRIGASSNADIMSNRVLDKNHNKPNGSTLHHWMFEGDQDLGQLQMKFQEPTSLVSLDIELSFNCRDIKALVEGISLQSDKSQITEQKSMIQSSFQEEQKSDQNMSMNLGLLNIHGRATMLEEGQRATQDDQTSKVQEYLPLLVHSHKGASYNQTFQVSRLVVDNGQVFASNYPKPEFFIKHQHDHIMDIDKFTVKTQLNSKCGGQPVGSGMIFLADNLSVFELTTPFHKFSHQDYIDWKQERVKDSTPLKPYEPVAYFEFENETSLTLDIDFRRPCKYIMLKPVGFRKKNTQSHHSNVNSIPMEIEFFAVSGSSYPDHLSLQNQTQDFTLTNLNSQYDLELKVLGTDHTIKTITNIEINQINAFDIPISPDTLTKWDKRDKQRLTGKASFKITDSQLQLQRIAGIQVNIISNKTEESIWQLRGATLEGVSINSKTQPFICIVNDQDSRNEVPLFDNHEIPASFMRSCLLSPKFFSVVNQVLASILSSDQHDYQLRFALIKFFNKIIKIDKDFIPLILREINLETFLRINLLDADATGNGQIFEFLQNFQRDFKFCLDLYSILLNILQDLPQKFLSFNGYEAFIGMLKWAIPINPEKTLVTLVQVVYEDICMKKMKLLQVDEVVKFRTRHQYNLFPFDEVIFKGPRVVQGQKNEKQIENDLSQTSQQQILPVKIIQKVVQPYHHIYDVSFDIEMNVTDLKIYLGLLDQSQYKLIVKVYGKDKIIYKNSFDEHYFAHFATFPYVNTSKQCAQDDALHIPNLNFKGDSLRIVIEFGIAHSSLPKQNSKIKPPNTLVELYGNPVDLNISQAKLKEMIDSKAQQYWSDQAKIFKVGRSTPMIQICKDLTECLLLPQGSSTDTQLSQHKEEEKKEDQVNQQQKPQVQSSRWNELSQLQLELKGKLNSNDSNIKEVVEKISSIQGFIHSQQDIKEKRDYLKSLEYYTQLGTDFFKLLRNIKKSQKVDKQKLNLILRGCDKEASLHQMCFEIFKRFVAYEQGAIKQEALRFIIEVLYPLMSYGEKKTFTFRIIEEFLSMTQVTFSQKAVLEALNTIGIPEGELISFLVKSLNIKAKPVYQQDSLKNEKMHPFILMSSVLILANNSLKSIDIPEPGQFIHKGVSCSICHAKMIIGWRYKCGNCPSNINLDEKCVEKHLQEHPNHVMIIIREPLPYNSKQSKFSKLKKKPKPLLPSFKFKELKPDEAMTHEFGCENCGKKPIDKVCFRCVNCEDYTLCEECYKNNSFDHFSYHLFMKLHKPLLDSDKNPTILLKTLLDPRLYEESIISEDLDSFKNKPLEEEDQEEEFEDLAPLSISRSFSVPMKSSQPTSISKQSKEDQYEKLDCDQQFVVLFQTCEWICQSPQKIFCKEEKVVLLKLAMDTLLQLIRLTNVKQIYEVMNCKDIFFNILVSVLQLNSRELISLFRSLLDMIRQPPSLMRKMIQEGLENKQQKQGASMTEKRQELNIESQLQRSLIETLISHSQNFLKWLVDIGLNSELAKIQIPQGQEHWASLLTNYANQKIWLEHLSLILELYIKLNDELKQLQKDLNPGSILESDIEEIKKDGEEELLPPLMQRSVSVPLKKEPEKQQIQPQSQSLQLIKSLVQLLYLNEGGAIPYISSPQKIPSVKQSHFREMEPPTKYLSQMWALVLKSLTAVSINSLIEARIFDSLVSAFLISTEEIKQITFPQILQLSETIAKSSVHQNDISKFICNLLFTTLENVTDNHHEKVGYSICQGWLDILITSSVARPPELEIKNQVFSKMSSEEVSIFLKKTSIYLTTFLNKGNFDGVAGCHQQVVMRLNLACDLMYVIRNTENKNKPGTLAVQDLYTQVASNHKLRKEYQESMENLLTWLFLNSRENKDDTVLNSLGNSSTLTPATAKVKQITQYVTEILMLLSESDNNEVAIKIALSVLTTIVKKMNRTILELLQSNSIGSNLAQKLSERSNDFFIKFLGSWLISDQVASYFVFDQGGFEFLLDTIGVGDEGNGFDQPNNDLGFEVISSSKALANLRQEEIREDSEKAFSSLVGSDLFSFLENSIQEFQQENVALHQIKQSDDPSQANAVAQNAEKVVASLQEFSKQLVMVSNNGGDPISSYQKTDWSVNKRGYKHRIIIKSLNGTLRSEYWMLFSLPSPVELKEIQIGFNNYWGAENEVYSEPLSVLVEAGMDQSNLSLICNLQIIKDDAFGSVSATVFGSNLESFHITQHDPTMSVEEIIQQKLHSLQNFKVQYIKFCMRRHVLSCVENSPLATKFTKPPAFGINYISLLGFDMSKTGDIIPIIKSEQKRTALEVLSIICSGDFSSILKVIANQGQTIEKMKKSFNQLASLVNVKKNLIEPTFIAISTYNTEMGDWIIHQFLKSGKIYKHASLAGEIVMCNRNELPRRLKMLQEFVLNELNQIEREDRSLHSTKVKKIEPFIQIFIQTLRVSAPLLNNETIDLEVKEHQLLSILNLLSGATEERQALTNTLYSLLVMLLCPPIPFKNTEVDVFDFSVKYLMDESTLSNEFNDQRFYLVSVFSVTRRALAQEILKRELLLEDILNPSEPSDSQSGGSNLIPNIRLQNNLKFWINIAHDQEIRKQLNSKNVAIQLYQVLREPEPHEKQRIIKNNNVIGQDEMLLIVELIKLLTAGDSKLEIWLATLLMKDLEYLSKIRDMTFVNKVFLQLLRIEQTIPVCLWPFDSDNKKWIPTHKPQIMADQLQVSNNINNFVPSSILQGEKRSAFIKNFKEIVGNHSKGNIKKYLSSNWVLAHSQSELPSIQQFPAFWKNIENKSPIVILVQCQNTTGQQVIYGAFTSKAIPALPSKIEPDQDYPVTSNPEDFMFCYIDDNNFYHYAPKPSTSILQMFTDYEGGGAISIANDFILLSYSNEFIFTVGVQYEIEQIQQNSNPKTDKEVPELTGNSLLKFEIWTLGTQVNQGNASRPKTGIAVKAQSNDEKFLDKSNKIDFKHPWLAQYCPYQLYRTNPVFMVPQHLTLNQLSKIILDSNVSFKARFKSSTSVINDQLGDLYFQLQKDSSYEQQNGIIDLEYDINQLLSIQSADEQTNKISPEAEEGASSENQQVISGYVPKMGLFEEFESQGGVKQIISVTLASLKLWKAEESAKSWELWLKELESFSEIPLFFQLFLKNSRCKDLLFKVLAGSPDLEISGEAGKTDATAKTKWEEEQKLAVQFNYRILSEAFHISNDLKLRETAMKYGLLPRILERLGAISGEKPRSIVGLEEEKKIEEEKEEKPQISQSVEKNIDKKKRKGVGYSSKVGQTFNVTAYLENKKQRNDQIKSLIDICSNFINCKEWKAGDEVLDILLESALLPLLESAFRNGSWYNKLVNVKALTRAIAGQKKLVKCLIEIDKKYKPVQFDPIYKLLAKLNDLAEIFINCLNQQQKSEIDKQATTESNRIKQEHQNVLKLLQQSYNMTLKIEDDKSDSDHGSLKLIKSPKVYPGSTTNAKNNEKSQSTINLATLKNIVSGGDAIGKLSSTSLANFSKVIGHQTKEQYKTVQPDKSQTKKFLFSKEEWDKKEEKKEDEAAPMKVHPSSQPFVVGSLTDSINQQLKKDKEKQEKEREELKDQLTKHTKDMFQNLQVFQKDLDESDVLPSEEQKSEDSKEESEQNEAIQDQSDSNYETISEESLESTAKKKQEEDSDKDIKKVNLSSHMVLKGNTKNQSKKNAKKETFQKFKKNFKSKKQSLQESSYYESEDDESEISYGSESEGLFPKIPKPIDDEAGPAIIKDKKKPTLIDSDDVSDDSDQSDETPDSSNPSDESDESESDEDSSNSSHSSSSEESSHDYGSESESEEISIEIESQNNRKKAQVSDQDLAMDSEIPEALAREVMKTYRIVQAAVEKLLKHSKNENFIENALLLPLPQAYVALLQDIRFDYMDMKDPNDNSGTHFKHHYQSLAIQNQNPPAPKMVRLAQELADLSNALPCEHTNAIYVRVDQSRVDMMKAIICGASNTPYAHGCYEYDIFCDNNYPRDPPKMNLITTGNGAVRFNPNLYACGKVCLSLLGTWRGSATENWDPKLSTILQVLLSTQAIIMSEEVYFNEPGFENEAGTPEGEKKNEGYSNIVKYCNIKFAMIDQIKKPSKGFETMIKRHFYLKKAEILAEVNQWVELAEKHEATYGGLVNDHNYNWANQFKQSKTKYKEMLVAAVKQLEEELNKLERPTDYELKLQQDQKKKSQQRRLKKVSITEGKAELDIDEEDDWEVQQINTESKKEIDIEDEAVKDRWSRYIGAMGVEAVAKQAAANIFLSGAGALGIEIAKNLVLAGCKSFTLHDNKPITYRDFSGQFFLNLEDDLLNEQKKKTTRGEASLPRLQQLNYYVRCKLAPKDPLPLDKSILEQEPWNLSQMDVIILTEATYDQINFFDEYCRSKNKKFICADQVGAFCRIFNDFGDKFEVLDKNGEDLQEVMIKNISNEEIGVVELHPTVKHKFEDGDEITISQIQGMKLLEGKNHEDPLVKSDSINDTIWEVTVVNPYTFKIGDTTRYGKYERNGIVKQLKTKKTMQFKSFADVMLKSNAELPLDGNLAVADFEKMQNNQLSHIAFEALDIFEKQEKRKPGVWNKEDAVLFTKIAMKICPRYEIDPEKDLAPDSFGLKFFYLFSFTSQGVFNPLCAFMGGLVAQECVKAITQKYTPVYQVFYYDAFEVLPDFDPTKDIEGPEEENKKDNYFHDIYLKEKAKTQELSQRYDGLRIVVGQDIVEQLAHTRLFMVGAGAIGCELLKNYAMLGVGVGKAHKQKKLPAGSIVLTDPDVIEVSNLNRQFLFREKHLRKPKSSCAASAAIYMNRDLQENIIARLDKVHEGTNHIFTDQFFEDLSVVTNALDNIQARRYIDARCVVAKTPLLESGTLGPKGHVQVVLPYKTESYGSMNDPEDNTEIPHCTLKMFPEETLHCVEWARDKFGKMFTQQPQSALKLLEEKEGLNPTSQQDGMNLKGAIKLLKKRPKNFDECVQYAREKFEKLFNHDIKQLLHVYPLDAKTKDGTLFWTLPKRPPVPIDFDPNNPLHCTFATSLACLRATIFKVEIPSKAPRSEEFRTKIGEFASKFKVAEFVPNDEKAKEIQASVNKQGVKEEEKKEGEQQEQEEEQKLDPNDMESLLKEFGIIQKDITLKKGETYSDKYVKPEEFEKDNDQNFHIDFIYCMANCRANNYKLDPMDWITVKLKAGRIVPALATTTACIAGLQTLELVKLLKGCKKTDHRNVFLNLAVPIMQASEPGDAIKTKLTEQIEVSLWDRWEVKKGKNVKLKEVIKDIEENYKGLEVRDVMKGNTPIYFHAILSGAGKEKEREKILNSLVHELAMVDNEEKYVDLTLTMIRTGDQEEKILSGVPPIRVLFE